MNLNPGGQAYVARLPLLEGRILRSLAHRWVLADSISEGLSQSANGPAAPDPTVEPS